MTVRTGVRDFGAVLRGMQDRLRALEQRQRHPVGSWRLEENAVGHLVAVHVPTGRVAVIATAYDPNVEREESPDG